MKLDIRPFEYKDMEQVHALHESAFGKDSLDRWKRRWKWQFELSPATSLTPSRSWVAERDDGRILGFIGSFPVRVKVDQMQVIAYEGGDLMVSKEARRQGIGQKLCKAFYENPELLVIANGHTSATGRIFIRLGLKPVNCRSIYVRALNVRLSLNFLLDSGRIPPLLQRKSFSYLLNLASVISNPILGLVNRVKRPKMSAKYTIEEIRQVSTEFDVLWNEISPEFPIIVIRDAKFAQWRFIEDPLLSHTLLGARDNHGKLRGYIDICIFEKRSMLVGRLVDIFCPPTSAEIIDALLAKAMEIFTERHVANISCLGLHPSIQDRVRRCFYFKPPSLQDPLSFLVYWKGKPQLKHFVHDPNSWHISHADGDEGFIP